ncbi:hypothetical protein N7445_006400 [Penicillium cf. griseofulvum]|nr:hypothetical protein N7445_006400 [Penicillium cf. griseofulvum]
MFLSRLLTPAEKHYWATELEVFCIVWVVRKIRHMIEAAPEGLTPIAYTDHIAKVQIRCLEARIFLSKPPNASKSTSGKSFICIKRTQVCLKFIYLVGFCVHYHP